MEKLRFRKEDGSEYLDWSTKKLKYYIEDKDVELGRGRVISKKDIFDNPGDNPVYSSSVVNGGKIGETDFYDFDEDLITWSIDGGGTPFLRENHSFSITNVAGYLRILNNSFDYRYLAFHMRNLHSRMVFDYQLKAHPSVIKNLYAISKPEIEEQKKIGGFLSSIDKLIDNQEDKIESLKDLKKGYLQQLFNQKLRFKDDNGNDYPEWKKIKLGDICTFSKGKGIPKEDLSDKGVECIRYGELYTRYSEVIDNVLGRTDKDLDKLVYSQEDDIIIPSSGETNIDLATASCVINENIALGGDINILRGNFDGVFMAYYLNNAKRNDIAKYAQGVSVVHLYSKHLKILELDLPSVDEQEKIGDFISQLERLINTNRKKLEQYKLLKKGYMQRIFYEEAK